MASSADIELMAKRPPPGYSDLYKAVQDGPQHALNIIGVVTDLLPVSKTSGTDYQMTFTLIDNSLLPNGLRVKFFKRSPSDMPAIQNHGDVVVLRKIKLGQYAGGLMALSNYHTEHVVFPRDAVVSPHFRVSYSVSAAYLVHTKSDVADMPSIAEQQWVITLSDHWKGYNHVPERVPSAPAAMLQSAGGLSVQKSLVNTEPAANMSSVNRTKFSLVRDLPVPKGGRKGTYCDLAGEVVKIHTNSYGTHDMFICDYTSNNAVHDYDPRQVEGSGWPTRPTPRGKMVFQVELNSPHGIAAQQTLEQGSIAFLKNVFVKLNSNGNLVGSLYQDQHYRDKVLVEPLDESNSYFKDIRSRRMEYIAQVAESTVARKYDNRPKGESKAARKKRRKKEREEADKGAHARTGSGIQQISDSSGSEVDDIGKPRAKRTKPNDLVFCDYPHISFSTFEAILEGTNRDLVTSAGIEHKLPFVNVNHRIRGRVVDFYPHDLRKFTRVSREDGSSQETSWTWDFWLVLQSAASNDIPERCLNVNVSGADAQHLLGESIIAQNLSVESARPLVNRLGVSLSTLWGELAKKKGAFLHAHPHIKGDDDFSAIKYNIAADTRPFEACISECGIEMARVPSSSQGSAERNWKRIYKLFGTSIRRNDTET